MSQVVILQVENTLLTPELGLEFIDSAEVGRRRRFVDKVLWALPVDEEGLHRNSQVGDRLIVASDERVVQGELLTFAQRLLEVLGLEYDVLLSALVCCGSDAGRQTRAKTFIISDSAVIFLILYGCGLSLDIAHRVSHLA